MGKIEVTRWEKSDISYQNYLEYIAKKQNRYELTFIDLLYVSNFKGGNATINEPELAIHKKLASYSEKLRNIEEDFKGMSLAVLTDIQLKNLVSKVIEICNLTCKNSETQIDGFSVSYLSALLQAYFPNLIPILDRRVLINLHLVSESDRNKQDQIKNIQQFYKPLIEKFAIITREKGQTLREVDKDLFAISIEKKLINN
jgi:hypothetical protein